MAQQRGMKRAANVLKRKQKKDKLHKAAVAQQMEHGHDHGHDHAHDHAHEHEQDKAEAKGKSKKSK
jgi:hypothetical protein